jgi:ABC-2 type transport system permease protein
MFAFYTMATVSYSFYRERWYGTWRRLLAAPLHPRELVFGKLVVGVLLFTVQFLAMLAFGAFALGIDFGARPGLVFVVVLSTALVASALGLLLTALTPNPLRMAALANVLVLLLAALGGAIVPLTLMPSWMQPLALLTPHYWALEALRDVMIRGGGFGEVWRELAVLWGVAAAAFVAGWRLLRLDLLSPM